jgi:hypothetical protein
MGDNPILLQTIFWLEHFAIIAMRMTSGKVKSQRSYTMYTDSDVE